MPSESWPPGFPYSVRAGGGITRQSGAVIPLSEEEATNNEIFLNAITGSLCWKDNQGAVHVLSVDAETYLGFTVENEPPATWTPYGSLPWNTPVAAGTEVHPNNEALRAFFLAEGGAPHPNNLSVGKEELGGIPNEKTDVAHPIIYASLKDPIYKVHCTREAGNVNEGILIHIPTTAKTPWAQGSDGHLCVVQPNGLAYEFYKVASIEAGTITANWSQAVSVGSSTGFLPSTVTGAGVTASNASLIGGIIRPPEITAYVAKGPTTIKHALCFIMNKITNSIAYGYGTTLINGTGAVYPATHSQTAGGSAAAGAAPLGARFKLGLNKGEVEALAMPAWKENIAMCLVEYGAYAIDIGGSAGFQMQSDRSWNAYNKPNPLVAYSAAHLSTALTQFEGYYVWHLSETIPWATALQFIAPPAH